MSLWPCWIATCCTYYSSFKTWEPEGSSQVPQWWAVNPDILSSKFGNLFGQAIREKYILNSQIPAQIASVFTRRKIIETRVSWSKRPSKEKKKKTQLGRVAPSQSQSHGDFIKQPVHPLPRGALRRHRHRQLHHTKIVLNNLSLVNLLLGSEWSTCPTVTRHRLDFLSLTPYRYHWSWPHYPINCKILICKCSSLA